MVRGTGRSCSPCRFRLPPSRATVSVQQEITMALSVIGAGFGRTGTHSLKLALEMLGLGPCHHMSDVMQSETQKQGFRAAGRGERVDWDVLYAGYKSAVDWPTAYFWK